MKINTGWKNYSIIGKILYVLQLILIIAILYFLFTKSFATFYSYICFTLFWFIESYLSYEENKGYKLTLIVGLLFAINAIVSFNS
ncbi:MAG: hypothetical protein EGQ35_02925 [Clostridiales bacterium]|nr:hypothetical protein [Clostridiales bacterium]